MKLRSFLYLNTKLIDDYLSVIDGFVFDVETRTESSNKQKGAGAKLGVSIISGEGKIGSNSTQEVKKEVRISDAAKFDRVYDFLSKENEVEYFEFLTDESFTDLSRDAFLEALVAPRFSKIKELANTARQIGELAEMFQVFSEKPLLDKEGRDAIVGLSKLEDLRSGKEISCVFNFEDNLFPLVAYLDEQYFCVSREQFVGQVYIFGKIQRKQATSHLSILIIWQTR